jgi:diguanylate cyclase (GGDEF)-like protein/PAS domain S-box-containing protein
MNYQKLTRNYIITVLVLGFLCVGGALINLPLEKLNLQFLFLVVFTIGIGSRITLQIPRLKSHIAVSDTFIFLALLFFGGECAILLAAIEAFFSSLRFCNKKLTVFVNAAAMALSTTVVVLALKATGLYPGEGALGYGGRVNDFIIALSVMAVTQFIVNTSVASIYDTLKNAMPLWETWKSKYVWTFITYLVGAASAGLLLQLSTTIGFGIVLATFPIIFFIYFSYRMYVKNMEMSITQAEQAEHHAKLLEDQSAALRESEERFRSAFNYAPIGIAIVSPAGKWLKVNHALCTILGYTEEDFLASNFQSMIFHEDLGATLVSIHELLSGATANCQLEQRYLHKSGRTVWASWSVSTASGPQSNQPNLIFQIQDITDKKLAEDKLHYEATHDALTGLPNRPLFMGKLANALGKARQYPGYKVSVLFIDLDRFKYVNDSLGHLLGDRLLIEISGRLRECMRPSDMVARLGGDEFTILVEGRYELSEVTTIAERIQEKFTVPFDLNGHEVYSSASIGILQASEKHLTPEDMMRDADTAMYQAKRAGKARHAVFDEEMHEAVKETLQLETDLRRAVEKEEFSVHYQPIYSLITGKIEGFEALARWNHAKLGYIPSKKFIPLAEEIGLIDTLSSQIIKTACLQIGALQTESMDAPLSLSVNLSCKQFAQPNLVQKIVQVLDQTGFAPSRFKLEITESVFFEHQERAIEMLNELCRLGMEIHIDDFGTGYSNLSYLVRLPVSTLKIDRSFISQIGATAGNSEIVQTIVLLARNLGMKVVAEGVETEYQLAELKKLDCEGAQGYLFARPMSFESLVEFMGGVGNADHVPKGEFEDFSVVSTVQ